MRSKSLAYPETLAAAFLLASLRGEFQYGDLQLGPGQRLGGSASESRGSHSYPQRSHFQSQTVFLTLATAGILREIVYYVK